MATAKTAGKATKSTHSTAAVAPRLKELYQGTYRNELLKELELPNVHLVPKLEKITLSVGIGKHKDDKRYHEMVVNTLRKISGQQPVDRMAKKSIATFKIRAGMNRVGVSVTLRGNRMYEFLDRFVNIALPRVRDFHGIPAGSFDSRGNYSLGITEQSIFPELNFEDTQVLHGLQVTFTLSAGSRSGASRALLEKFGMPFEKEGNR